MPEFRYARGRIGDSIQYISEEMKEFDMDYADKSWKDYQSDKKLQKLMDRTVENILTALIEVCGTMLTEEGVGVDSYSDALRKSGKLLGLSVEEQESFGKLAIQRNRLAHRYLDFRWQAVRMYKERRKLIVKLITRVLEREEEQ
ncbi:MAG TPA: DUF86 domain-containing protein [Nitrospirae bacterium]|nr:DUF86 domain-containing protein [Nitrospirota bacterium]